VRAQPLSFLPSVQPWYFAASSRLARASSLLSVLDYPRHAGERASAQIDQNARVFRDVLHPVGVVAAA
jgi:hypothetical protein